MVSTESFLVNARLQRFLVDLDSVTKGTDHKAISRPTKAMTIFKYHCEISLESGPLVAKKYIIATIERDISIYSKRFGHASVFTRKLPLPEVQIGSQALP